MAVRRVNIDGLDRLAAFSHATIAGDQVFVAGQLGTAPGTMTVIEGGVAAQTTQALRNIATILDGCGCTFADVAKVNVYLTDMATFGEMNEAYLAVVGDDPPARITIGCKELALGAAVEIDCVAFTGRGGS